MAIKHCETPSCFHILKIHESRYTAVYSRSVQFLFTTSLLSTQKLFVLSFIVLSVIELYKYKLPYIYPFYSRVTKFEKIGKNCITF